MDLKYLNLLKEPKRMCRSFKDDQKKAVGGSKSLKQFIKRERITMFEK